MSEYEIMEIMEKIMNPDELARMLVRTKEDGSHTIRLDLHELDRKKAARLLKNTINVNRRPFTLRVIHGFHGGTAIREMVRQEVNHRRIKEKIAVPWNPGETYIRIA